MRTPKYHIYLSNEERSEVLKSLIGRVISLLCEFGRYVYSQSVDITFFK